MLTALEATMNQAEERYRATIKKAGDNAGDVGKQLESEGQAHFAAFVKARKAWRQAGGQGPILLGIEG